MGVNLFFWSVCVCWHFYKKESGREVTEQCKKLGQSQPGTFPTLCPWLLVGLSFLLRTPVTSTLQVGTVQVLEQAIAYLPALPAIKLNFGQCEQLGRCCCFVAPKRILCFLVSPFPITPVSGVENLCRVWVKLAEKWLQ